jgi:hypothetical protein
MIEALLITSTKFYYYIYIFISFTLTLFSNPQFCSLTISIVAWDILGGLADLEQPLGELLLIGSLLEKWSKVIDVSSCITQEQTVRPPPGLVRPLALVHQRANRQHRPVWPPVPGVEALGPLSCTHRHVHVVATKLSMSTHFLVTLLRRISG